MWSMHALMRFALISLKGTLYLWMGGVNWFCSVSRWLLSPSLPVRPLLQAEKGEGKKIHYWIRGHDDNWVLCSTKCLLISLEGVLHSWNSQMVFDLICDYNAHRYYVSCIEIVCYIPVCQLFRHGGLHSFTQSLSTGKSSIGWPFPTPWGFPGQSYQG